MRKLLLWVTLLTFLSGAAHAAIINVTGGNYMVTKIDWKHYGFGADLVQNHARHTRTEVRINKSAHCWRVHPGRADTLLTRTEFLRSLHRGTRVRVNGGRSWDGKINASDVWAEN